MQIPQREEFPPFQSRQEVVIHAPLQAVWEFNQDLTNIAVYHPRVKRVDLISGKRQRGNGVAYRCYLKDGKNTCVEKDLEVVPMERIVTALPEDTMGITKMLPDYLVEARLTPLAENETKVEFSHYYSTKSLKAKLFNVIAKRKIARDSQNTLEAMKRTIEKHASYSFEGQKEHAAMDKTPDPIQELVTAARRKQILDAATQVFAEKGFHRATIKDIARVAGIADGTIYTYFASKTEVLLGILHRLNESTEREQQLMPEREQDLRSFFTAYLRQRMALLWPNAEVFQAVLPEMLVNEQLRELYYQQVLVPTFTIAEHAFQAQQAAGQVQSLDVPLTVRAIAGLLLGLLTLQLLGDEMIAQRWEELPEVLTSLLFDGLQQGKETTHQ